VVASSAQRASRPGRRLSEVRGADTMAMVMDGMSEAQATEALRQQDEAEAAEHAGPAYGTRSRSAVPTRPGAELSLYVCQVAPGKFQPCAWGYGGKRVSKVVFLKFQLKLWASPSAERQQMYEDDPASRAAAEGDSCGTLLSFMTHKRYKAAHTDWLSMENYGQKYHANNAWSKWVTWCGEMACKIATSSGDEQRELLREAASRANVPMPIEILQSLRQSCERGAGVEKNYGSESDPNMIPGQGILLLLLGCVATCILYLHPSVMCLSVR
jgi:hypothetical protein